MILYTCRLVNFTEHLAAHTVLESSMYRTFVKAGTENGSLQGEGIENFPGTRNLVKTFEEMNVQERQRRVVAASHSRQKVNRQYFHTPCSGFHCETYIGISPYHTLCCGFHYETYIGISPYHTQAVV